MPPKKKEDKKEPPKKEDSKKSPEPKKAPEPEPKKEEQSPPPPPPPPAPEPEPEPEPEEDNTMDEAAKKKRQAEMFKKYLEQTGIAMAFQVVFAEILDKKVDENKVFSYTAMRLRQIGQDLEKIKLSKR